MILSFRPWWRTVQVLALLALLPLAWRGLGREAPILIQQVPAGSAVSPPPVVELAAGRPASPGGPWGAAVAEAAAGGVDASAAAPGDPPPAAEGGPTGEAPCPDGETPRPVNINTAGAAALESLPGIGPALAARILEYRERWGPFTAPEQLTEVPGIGEKRLEQLLPWITVE